MSKVVLIDGNNLVFRSYYATAYNGNVMKNSKGFPTNAIYGFINMINKIINEEKPIYVMIAFDKGKTFRHDKYKEYKSGRIEMPIELKEQFPICKQICTAMGIKYYEIDNYEADDIIGTFAKKIDETDDFDGLIVSSDKDLLQLISDSVKVKLLKQSGFVMMDKKEFKSTYQVEPINMIDLKALMGDSSDNIPGVKGIGEKTAINLLSKYHTLDNLYNNLDELTPKNKEKLELDKESAYYSYFLATICKEVPMDISFDDIKYKGINALEYIKILEDLEFYSLIKKIDIDKDLLDTKKESIDLNIDTKIIEDINDLKIDCDYSLYLEIYGVDYRKDDPIGIYIYSDKFNYYLPFALLKSNPYILNTNYKMYTYDLKKVLYIFKRFNIDIPKCDYDAMIASYILNYNVKDDISYLANNKGYDVMFYDQEFDHGKNMHMPPLNELVKNMAIKAKFIYDTKDDFLESLNNDQALMLFSNIEMPLVEVLTDMEYEGINVDKDYLINKGKELDEQLSKLEKEIFSISQIEFNISSPKQLGDILFTKLNIPYPKKVKDNNYSTSKEILDKLKDEYDIVKKILDYRMLSKLKSNYISGLINEIMPDGKVHTMFTQTLTRTGRLSSVSPNLQNIPIRTEEGKLIRKAFLPNKDSLLLSSDYSQIELRIFASFSNATNLIEAFKNGDDIHAKTASDIFHKPINEITKEERRQAKAVNFGILYGISGFGLAEDLGIDFKEANSFIEKYLETYPDIKKYKEEIISSAKSKGYVKTIMNRKRIIDELNNKNYMIVKQGERIALNTPIQGSSADILKKAMVEIYNEFKEKKLKSKMLIQVHDELVFNVYNDELDTVKEIVKRRMENTYKLNVPLVVDIEIGKDWFSAK